MLNSLINLGELFELEKHFQVQFRRSCGLVVALLLGCAPVPLADGERRQALQQATDQVILPTYRDLSSRTRDLAELCEELEADPAASDLEALRQAYLDARQPLEEAAAFGFGPATELHSPAALDQAPIDPGKIDAELGSDAELTLEGVELLGANKRGLHAIEYLLFPADDAELEAALLASDGAGQRRRLFLEFAAQIVADSADELHRAWAAEPAGYARRFAEPGAADSVYPTVQAGLDTLVNQLVFLSELVANDKLGRPLGAATGGEIDVSAQESERSGASIADALGNVRGMRNVYLGTRDGSAAPSLSSLVRAKSPSTDLRARRGFDTAEADLQAIPEPLGVALVEAPQAVTAAYESIKTLKRLLATEVLGTLGASLKFNDNDGD